MAVLRGGKGADLLLVDVALDIRDLVMRLEAEHIAVPIAACGIASDARAAVAAIHAGAKEYIPLPPDPELIAAVLAAVANDSRELVYRDDDGPRHQVGAADRRLRRVGDDHRRKRHRQGSAEALRSHPLAPRQEAVHQHQLRGDPRASAGVRIVRTREGRFTGAVARRIGKFEEATGGTLLLDEISEMDRAAAVQALLRAIQERVIDRVDGSRPVPVDIRIIATSNRNLQEAVRAGTFREDLLFRLNVVNLKILLRERPADILELAQHFCQEICRRQPACSAAADLHDARRVLTANRWQGNVRELENTIHRAVLMVQGDEIGADAILTPDGDRLDETRTPPAVAHATFAAEQVTRALVGRTVADVERDLILETLKHCLGNRTHAANILGISIRLAGHNLYRRQRMGVPAGAEDGHGKLHAIDPLLDVHGLVVGQRIEHRLTQLLLAFHLVHAQGAAAVSRLHANRIPADNAIGHHVKRRGRAHALEGVAR